jgi:hypothetical protein
MTTEELGALVRMLAEKTPLGLLSNMQARTIFEYLEQQGWTISPPRVRYLND